MNKKVAIRIVEGKDVPAILEIYSPYVLESAVSFEVSVPSETEMWERIYGILKEHPYLVCEVEGVVAGYAYVSNHRQREAYKWSKEISAYIHPDFRGKGIATSLYSSLFGIVKIQGFTNLLAGITIPNPASIGFHEKMGFRKLGEFTAVGYKLGKWHNVGWWELNLNSGLLPPKEQIIPFSEIKNAEKVKKILSLRVKEVII